MFPGLESFFSWMLSVLKSALLFILEPIYNVILSILNFIIDILLSIVETIIDGIDFLFQGNPFDVNMAWSGLPDQAIWAINRVDLPVGISMILTAITIRLIINLIPSWATRI